MKTFNEIKPADYRKLSDEELIRRYVELHEYNAYNFLFERFAHTVFGICLSLNRGDAAAAGLKTEELFLAMLRDLKQMKAGAFKPWLFNYVVRSITGRPAVEEEINQPVPSGVQPIIPGAIPKEIENSMSALSREEQMCIRLFYEGNMTMAQIGSETGLSLPTVKRLLHSGKIHAASQLAQTGQLAHVFDKSVCLTRRQVRDYLTGQMETEETHAIEHHLSTCSLCSTAIDGMYTDRKGAVNWLQHPDNRFLNDHFSMTFPQVQMSSFVMNHSGKNVKKNKIPLWVHLLLGGIISIAVAWLFYTGKYKLHLSWINP